MTSSTAIVAIGESRTCRDSVGGSAATIYREVASTTGDSSNGMNMSVFCASDKFMREMEKRFKTWCNKDSARTRHCMWE